MASVIVKVFIVFSISSVVQGIEVHTGTKCPSGCQCLTAKYVECRGNNVVLDYIPKIPTTTLELHFRDNSLPQVYMDTFENITFQHGLRLEVLDLSNNGIVSISTMAFSRLTYVKKLVLNKNFLSDSDGLQKAIVGLKYIHIQTLVLQYMDIDDEYVPPNLFHPLTNLNTINIIDLSHNNLNDFDFQTLTNLTSLQEFVMTDNRLSVLSGTSYDVSYPGVQRLDFRSNSILEMPFFCDDGRSIFPNLSFLFLDDNFITNLNIEDFNCLSSVKELSLSQNPVKYIPPNIFASMSSLVELRLNNMPRVPLEIAPGAFKSPSLRQIYLSNNMLSENIFTVNVFQGIEELHELDLSGSNLDNLPSYPPELQRSFLPQSLTSLFIRNSRLPAIPRMFLPSLLVLNLGGNEIDKISTNDLAGFPNLTVLNLDGNRLTRIHEDFIPEELKENLKAVDIGDNPLLCTCEILWIQKWLLTNPLIFLADFGPSINCIDTDTSEYILLEHYKPNCRSIRSPYTTTIITVSVVSGLAICVSVVLVVWYRQRIKMWYISGRRRGGEQLVLDNDTNTVI